MAALALTVAHVATAWRLAQPRQSHTRSPWSRRACGVSDASSHADDTGPKRPTSILVCNEGMCRDEGAARLREVLESADTSGCIEWTGCIGTCGPGVCMEIEYSDGDYELLTGLREGNDDMVRLRGMLAGGGDDDDDGGGGDGSGGDGNGGGEGGGGGGRGGGDDEGGSGDRGNDAGAGHLDVD